MLFQIRREGPLAPKYFLQSFNGTPHPLVRLELSRGASSSTSGTVCELEQVFQNDSQTFSSCQCYDSYTLLFIHVCSGWNFGFSLRETSLLTLGRQVCAVQNTSNCTECAVIAACSVRTGYVFFGTLVNQQHRYKKWLLDASV